MTSTNRRRAGSIRKNGPGTKTLGRLIDAVATADFTHEGNVLEKLPRFTGIARMLGDAGVANAKLVRVGLNSAAIDGYSTWAECRARRAFSFSRRNFRYLSV